MREYVAVITSFGDLACVITIATLSLGYNFLRDIYRFKRYTILMDSARAILV